MLLKSSIANVLKCQAHSKRNFKCICVTMCSIVMNLISYDYIKKCFNLLTSVQHLHRASFLDGRTSILVKTTSDFRKVLQFYQVQVDT